MTPIWLEFAGGSNDGLKDGSQLTPSCVDALPTRLVSESVSMDYCRARAAEVVGKIWMTDIRLPSPKYHIEFNLAIDNDPLTPGIIFHRGENTSPKPWFSLIEKELCVRRRFQQLPTRVIIVFGSIIHRDHL